MTQEYGGAGEANLVTEFTINERERSQEFVRSREVAPTEGTARVLINHDRVYYQPELYRDGIQSRTAGAGRHGGVEKCY